MVEILLNDEATGLVMSFKFMKKKRFKLKKIKRLIYVRSVNGTFNEEKSIEYTVEINVIGGQK